MSEVYDENGRLIRKVKNLGWLLKHWKDVESFTIDYAKQSQRNGSDCILIAYLKNGGWYETEFSCYSVCIQFLTRPVFYGLKVQLVCSFGSQRVLTIRKGVGTLWAR